MQKYSGVKFIANGDCKQNKPIGMDKLNGIDKEQNLLNCVSLQFPQRISLKECKTLNLTDKSQNRFLIRHSSGNGASGLQ